VVNNTCVRLLTRDTPKLLSKWIGPFTVVNFCGRCQEDPEDTSDMGAYKLALLDYAEG